MKLSELLKKPESLEAAENNLNQLHQEKEKLSGKLEGLDKEIQELKAKAGDEALQDSISGTQTAKATYQSIREKEAEKEATAAAIDKLDGHMEQARKNKLAAKAKAKRKEAAELQTELNGLLKERDKLLAKIKEIEGCEYVPIIQTTPPPGTLQSPELRKKRITPASEWKQIKINKLYIEAQSLELSANQ